MGFPTVKLKCDKHLGEKCKGSHDIEVSCNRVQFRANGEKEPCPVYIFEARVGDVIYEHRMTVGPVEGEFVPLTLDQHQKDIDAARLMAARHAHFRHVAEELESQIK
jgi:hypothetical protein